MAYSSALFAVLVVAICHNAAQSIIEEMRSSEPVVSSSNADYEYLEGHNKARAAVGVEPLKWSEQLAKDASLMARYQRNKKGSQLANLTNHKYGTNQLWESGAAETPSMAVETWVKEKEQYHYASNSCVRNHVLWTLHASRLEELFGPGLLTSYVQ